jgi:hypothetical protein
MIIIIIIIITYYLFIYIVTDEAVTMRNSQAGICTVLLTELTNDLFCYLFSLKAGKIAYCLHSLSFPLPILLTQKQGWVH